VKMKNKSRGDWKHRNSTTNSIATGRKSRDRCSWIQAGDVNTSVRDEPRSQLLLIRRQSHYLWALKLLLFYLTMLTT